MLGDRGISLGVAFHKREGIPRCALGITVVPHEEPASVRISETILYV